MTEGRPNNRFNRSRGPRGSGNQCWLAAARLTMSLHGYRQLHRRRRNDLTRSWIYGNREMLLAIRVRRHHHTTRDHRRAGYTMPLGQPLVPSLGVLAQNPRRANGPRNRPAGRRAVHVLQQVADEQLVCRVSSGSKHSRCVIGGGGRLVRLVAEGRDDLRSWHRRVTGSNGCGSAARRQLHSGQRTAPGNSRLPTRRNTLTRSN